MIGSDPVPQIIGTPQSTSGSISRRRRRMEHRIDMSTPSPSPAPLAELDRDGSAVRRGRQVAMLSPLCTSTMGDMFEEVPLDTPHHARQRQPSGHPRLQHEPRMLMPSPSPSSRAQRSGLQRQESAPRRSSIHGASSSRRESDQFNELKADFAIVLRRRPADLTSEKTSDANDRTDDIKKSLMQGDLEVEEIRSFDGHQSILLVSAEQGRTLQRAAENMKLKMQTHSGTWKEFRITELNDFVDERERSSNGSGGGGGGGGCYGGGRGSGRKPRSLFRSSERQLIIDYIIQTQQSEGYLHMFSEYVEQCMPLQMLDRQEHLGNLWSFQSAMRREADGEEQEAGRGHCCPCFTLAAMRARCRRVALVCSRLCGLEDSLLDEIRNYYGEEIGFYFAWLSFYTSWLILPSIAGAGLFGLQLYAKSLDNPLAAIYAVVMALWATGFIVCWRRRSASLAQRWGVLRYEEEEVQRPKFKAERLRPVKGSGRERESSGMGGIEVKRYKYRKDEVTGEDVKFYPAWKRRAKIMFISAPCCVVCIFGALSLALWVFSARTGLMASFAAAEGVETEDWNSWPTAERLKDHQFWLYLLITPCLYGLLIPLLDWAFTRLARWLNDYENHQTESQFSKHLIAKVFSFRFVNTFSSLYYYAFMHSMLNLAVQLAAFMVIGQFAKNIVWQTAYPYLRRRYHDWKLRCSVRTQIRSALDDARPDLARMGRAYSVKSEAEKAQMVDKHIADNNYCAAAWSERSMRKYDTFEDYTEMLIQFGYVSFFSMVFPLAPLFALLNNVLELRCDGFKLLWCKQRPIAKRAGGIGVWLTVLNIMSVIAVVTNFAHLAFTSKEVRLFFTERGFDAVQQLLAVVAVEHLVLSLKFAISYLVPAIPHHVLVKERKERHDAVRGHTSASAAAADGHDCLNHDDEDIDELEELRNASAYNPEPEQSINIGFVGGRIRTKKKPQRHALSMLSSSPNTPLAETPRIASRDHGTNGAENMAAQIDENGDAALQGLV